MSTDTHKKVFGETPAGICAQAGIDPVANLVAAWDWRGATEATRLKDKRYNGINLTASDTLPSAPEMPGGIDGTATGVTGLPRTQGSYAVMAKLPVFSDTAGTNEMTFIRNRQDLSLSLNRVDMLIYTAASNTTYLYLYAEDAADVGGAPGLFDGIDAYENTTAFIVWTWDYTADEVKLYINGDQITTGMTVDIAGKAPPSTTSQVRIGQSTVNTTPQYDTYIFNSVLTPTQISNLYTQLAPRYA